MSHPNQASYRQIFKATTLFGGVQAYNILISLIRAKFVALFLGPAGLGILNLLSIPIGFIAQLTGLGLGYSAVRDISQATASGDEEKIGRTLSVFRRWVWLTGLTGATLTLILSPWLSRWTFGNGDYTYAFMFLSITLVFNALSSGYGAVLQGMRRLRHLAKAGVIGSTIGLIASIPLYYYYKINGIVPTIIIAAVTSLILNWYYGRRIIIIKPKLSWKEVWHDGNSMVRLGIMITLSGLISTLVSYLINLYVSRTGGVSQVGLYQAGFSITDKYVGLVFAAMATDYYPRLSGVIKDQEKRNQMVNQQAELSLLILAPILILLLTSLPLIVRILYTPQFMPIMEFIPFILLGIPLKAAAWAMGFIILANGDSKLYLFSELVANGLLLVFSLTFYFYFGLKGLGVAFLSMYLIYFVFILVLSRSYYSFSFTKSFNLIFLFTILLCLLSVINVFILKYPIAYYSGGCFIILSCIFSWVELNKRIDLKLAIKQMLRNNEK